MEVEKGGRGSLGKFGLSTAFRTERGWAPPRPPLHRPGFPGGPAKFSWSSRDRPWVRGELSARDVIFFFLHCWTAAIPRFGRFTRWDTRELARLDWGVEMVTIACLSGGQVHGLRIISDYSVREDSRCLGATRHWYTMLGVH